ncbi:hypothetical protein FE257_011456 [Aspergillus nanangensis]|uniref:Oligopeptide transporter n=1 Tax=Aspergillus nanangensis TaxID=2582783 RepID=A0AAD4GQK3_ASPNN|nr:hypothetical protein FE257_011456 [Aspergillus nanangensis]
MTMFDSADEVDVKNIQPSENDSYPDKNDSHSDILRAAGIGIHEDDPTEAVLTLRMWILGIGFCIVASGLNTLYTLRNPSITISSSVVLLVAYPVGKLWEKVVPSWHVSLGSLGSFNLNPGPFNQKVSITQPIRWDVYVRLGADVLTEQQMFYGYSAGWGFQILITMATFVTGFCLAGFLRPLVVTPRELIWPGVLSSTALATTLHGLGQRDVSRIHGAWRISRYVFFNTVFLIAFCCPRNKIVNQLFGMKSGMGLLPLTFDCEASFAYTTISNATNLITRESDLSSSVYDNTGAVYNVSRVVGQTTGFELDTPAYEAYSAIYLPITYGLNMFGLSFATLSSLIVWICLEKRHVMSTAVHRILHCIKNYPRMIKRRSAPGKTTASDVPFRWYAIACVLALFLSIFSVEFWEVELRWYGVLLAWAVAFAFFGPLALVYATSNLKINIDIFCRIIAGFVFEGKVLANIWFFDLGYITTIKGLYSAQDMKLAHYCNIPPQKVFLVQCVGMVAGTLSSVSVLNWALGGISGVCTSEAPNGFSCPYSRTHFNTSLIWGAVGPQRFFNNHIGYRALLYFFILGAVLPIPVHVLKRKYPSSLWSRVHVPLFLGGLNYLPPATGMNYGSWALVGLTFGYVVKKYVHVWWYKFNFVLSAALDSSVSVAGVVIFFAVFYSGASSGFSWWGTEIYKQTCDWKGCPYLSVPDGQTFDK